MPAHAETRHPGSPSLEAAFLTLPTQLLSVPGKIPNSLVKTSCCPATRALPWAAMLELCPAGDSCVNFAACVASCCSSSLAGGPLLDRHGACIGITTGVKRRLLVDWLCDGLGNGNPFTRARRGYAAPIQQVCWHDYSKGSRGVQSYGKSVTVSRTESLRTSRLTCAAYILQEKVLQGREEECSLSCAHDVELLIYFEAFTSMVTSPRVVAL